MDFSSFLVGWKKISKNPFGSARRNAFVIVFAGFPAALRIGLFYYKQEMNGLSVGLRPVCFPDIAGAWRKNSLKIQQ